MTSLYLVGGFVAVVGIAMGILVWVSRSSGKSSAEWDTLEEGHNRREAFDEETNRPVARGRDLLDRLRDMGG